MTTNQRIEKLEKAVQMLVVELYGPNRGGLSEAFVKEIYDMCHTTTGTAGSSEPPEEEKV